MTKKEAYIDKLSKQLKDAAAWIDDLEARTAETSADIKAGYDERIKALKEKKEALTLKVREVQSSTGDAWRTMTAGVDAAKRELKDAIAAARDKLRKAA